MFSRLFLKPLTQDEVDRFGEAGFSKKAVEFEEGSLLRQGFNDMGRGLKIRHTGTRALLSSDYTMCFDGVSEAEGEVAVPYESVFRGVEHEFYQQPWREVKTIYRSEGVAFDNELHLPEDHLSFELEFLAYLSGKMQTSLVKGDIAELLRLINVSHDFLVQHPLAWYELFAHRANHLLSTRFYKGAIRACQGYLENDLKTLDCLAATLSENDSGNFA